MRRVLLPTPWLDKLRLFAVPQFAKRGLASNLAKKCGVSRHQISVWFKKGKGRMTASSALSAARFFEKKREDNVMWFIPEWEELQQIVLAILEAPGYRAELARFCSREPHQISRYFNSSQKQRRQPDGDVALATLAWLTRKRLRWLDAEHDVISPPPLEEWRPLEKAFNLESQLYKRRQAELARKSTSVPNIVPMWVDLFLS